MLKVPTKSDYYVKATNGKHLRVTLAQTAERAAELMAADIRRFDPFQKH